jgi:Putative prokaryotic signal transducing protein
LQTPALEHSVIVTFPIDDSTGRWAGADFAAAREGTAMSNDLVTVATFADPVEANLAKNRLEASGVRAFLANEETVDMDWLLGNALGWIRLEVGDQDADAARAVLNRQEELETSSDVGPEKAPSALDEVEPIPEPDLEVEVEAEGGDDFDREPTGRDRDAERAFRGAVLGVLFAPVQFYVFYLLVKVFVSDESLGDRERRRAIIAAVLCLFTLVGWYLFFRRP